MKPILYQSAKPLLQKINFFSALLMAFWLPLERTFFPIAIWIWIGTWLLEGDLKNKLTFSFKNKYKQSIFILVFLFYIMHIVGLIYSEDISKGLSDVQLKVIMILFVIVMPGLNDYYRKKPHFVLAGFLFGTLTISLIAFIVGIINGGSHLSSNIQDLPFIHHTYVSMYVNFSVILSLYFFEKHIIIKPRSIWLIISVFFGIIIWLLESRAGMVLYALIIIVWLIYIAQRLNYPKLLSRSVIVIILGMSIFFITKNKRFKPILNMVIYSSVNQQKTNEPKIIPIRFRIWDSSLDVIQNNFLTGVGTGDVKTELKNSYKSNEYFNCYTKRLNAHNQFIETFIKLGIIGFLLQILLFLIPIYYSIKEKHYLLLSLIFILLFYWFVESMLCRVSGIAFFVLFYNYLVFNGHYLKQQRWKLQ